MEIVLVRHGQPDWEPGGRAVDDPGLTEYGHQQAARVAEALAGERFDAILHSTFRRTQETAAPIGRTLGITPSEHSWLRELGLPSLAGSTTEEVRHYFQNARARDLDTWWDGFPGGESFRHFYDRVSSGLDGLLTEQHGVAVHEDATHRFWKIKTPDQRLLIVAHEGTNAVLVSHLLSIPPVPWAHLRFASSWCGISRLRALEVAGRFLFTLDHFDEVDHMSDLVDPVRGRGRSTEH